jgi:hypothetical protein
MHDVMLVNGYLPRRRLLATTIVAAAVLISGFAMLCLPSSQAADDPKYVRGYVKDYLGNAVADVSVVVNMREQPANTTRTTKSDTTDSSGFYSCFFDTTEWEVGDLIEVIADYKGDQRANYTDAIDQSAPFITYVNITYPYEIPEFLNLTGFFIAGGAIGLLAAIFIVVKKRA